MANTRTFQRSFAGGEMSPQMLGHVGDPKFQSGAARLRNFIATPQGTAMRRPGFSYVAATKDSGAKTSVLLPFRYSNTDALVIEMGAGYFRFHRDGAPIKYLPSIRQVSSVDHTVDRITFAVPHGFISGEAIRVIKPGASTIPAGLSESLVYYTRFVSSYIIEVSLTSTPGAAVALTSNGIGSLYFAKVAEMPDDYQVSHPVAAVSGLDRLLLGAHDFQTNDPIQFTHLGSLPTPLVAGVIYYAVRYDANHINIKATLTGGNIALSGPLSNATVHYGYLSGDLANYVGSGVYRCISDGPLSNGPGSSYWHLLPYTGIFEIINTYAEADLGDVQFVQSNDVVKFAHADYDLLQLSRYGPLDWTQESITSYAPEVVAPAISVVTPTMGESFRIYAYSINGGGGSPSAYLRGQTTAGDYTLLPIATGDVVYIALNLDGSGTTALGVPALVRVAMKRDPGVGIGNPFSVQPIAGGQPLTMAVTNNYFVGYMWITSSSANRNEYYKVSALTADGVESEASPVYQAVNDLLVPGASNQVVWPATTGAARYRVYKAQTGLYGFIGDTDDLAFIDENLGPDLTITPLLLDTSLNGATNPSTLAYFEQRLVLANTQTIWMTRSNTELELSYHLPVVDTDRVKFTVQARDVSTIRHIVPLDNLILLTDSTEFVVTPVNSDALTPTSFRVRAVSYIGANTVRPVVVNNTLVFCAARGGHVWSFGRSEGGYSTGDVSLRAAHLFEGLTVTRMAHQKAPYSIVWCISSDGTLLGMTFVPEEDVAGWHWHDTEGTFESVAVIPEGAEDRVYVIVKRTINGSVVRYVERLGVLAVGELTDACYVDASVTLDERNTSAITIVATTATTWTAGSAITLTASSRLFTTGTPTTGTGVAITDTAGTECRFTITSVTSETVVIATPDITVPTGIRTPTANTNWAGFRRVIPGATYLEAESVDVLADGEIQFAQTVAAGVFTLPAASSVTHFGLPYTSELRTLPVAFQIDGAVGQGRTKGVNRLWLRIIDSCRFEVGPSEDDMSTTNDIDEDTLVSAQEIDVNIPSDWTDGGQVWVRQTDPVPLAIVSLVAEVSVGS